MCLSVGDGDDYGASLGLSVLPKVSAWTLVQLRISGSSTRGMVSYWRSDRRIPPFAQNGDSRPLEQENAQPYPALPPEMLGRSRAVKP